MGELLLSAGVWVTQLLSDILPDSPITDLLDSINAEWSALAEGLRVLNYFVDINAMVVMLGVWLVVVMIYYGKIFALRSASGLAGALNSVKTLAMTLFTQGG